MKIKGYTLIEILVVVVIIATLAALAWPNYVAIQEKTLNREAKASLALIRAAEKIYRLEQGYYYPYPPEGTSTNVVSDINTFLKLSLPETANVSWSISIDSTPSAEFSRATRTGSDGRAWTIDFTGDASDPVCSGGSNCP
ncbi:MAG: prepilin-type N-terminal cleavage/methylation domain-containing protein [Candidatus Omnitrophica bacterium]|nr:prepilin-type N-terminal cleavage/methylation domain-containing protein [Candidatus Omnitrophota bacterium]